MNRKFAAAAAFIWGALLVACGGSNDTAGINGSGLNNGGSPTDSVAVGVVTAFGSVFVNGVEFSTTGAQFNIDGNSGAETDLQVGDVVTVTGTINTATGRGTATRVSFNDRLEGAIVAIDTTNKTFTVFNQIVRVSAATAFDSGISPADLTGSALGDMVGVSGFVSDSSTGMLEATRVERHVAAATLELFGKVSSIAVGTALFNVDSTTVNHAGVTILNGPLAVGDCVEVKGSAFVGGQLLATSVAVENCGPSVSNGLRGEVAGIVTGAVTGSGFNIGDVSVSLSGSPSYQNGTFAKLAAGVAVEAEGVFNSSGVLVADQIKFELDAESELRGSVAAAPNLGANTLQIFGVTVQVNALTQFEDLSSAGIRQFELSDIAMNDYLVVHGSLSGTIVTAVRVERRNPPGGSAPDELGGIATDAVPTTTFKVLGVLVDTTGAQFEGAANAADFYATIAVGGVAVEVQGTWNSSNNTFFASEVEIED